MAKKTSKHRTSKALQTPILIELANSGEQPKLLKSSVKAKSSLFLEEDSYGNTFLDYTDLSFKTDLLKALENDTTNSENLPKIQIILESTLKHNQFSVFDKKGRLSKNSMLSFLLEKEITSFKQLKVNNITLDSQVPGCPQKRKLIHFYTEYYQSSFWKYISDNIDNVEEYGINRSNALAFAVLTKATLADIHMLMSCGVYLESQHISLQILKEHVASCSNDVYKPKILNTINLFEKLKEHKKVSNLIGKPHFSKVRNSNSNTVLHELAEQGYESECVSLLRRKNKTQLCVNDHEESIWHTAAKHNLINLLTFLLENQKKYIDNLNGKGLSPWSLAVLLGNTEAAKLLERKGANTRLFINEQGQTLLHYAITIGDDELVNRCYDCNTRADVPDVNGYTPSFYAKAKGDDALGAFLQNFKGAKNVDKIDFFNAVVKGDDKAVTLLIEKGVDPHLKNSLNRTALDMAEIYEHSKVSKILKSKGVKLSLARDEINKLKKQLHYSAKSIRSTYKIYIRHSNEGAELSIIEQDAFGKESNRYTINPWSKKALHKKTGNWKIINHDNLIYILLVNNDNISQPDAAFILSPKGDIKLSFANLPNSQLIVNTYADFSLETISHVNHLSVKANNISLAKQSNLFNGTNLNLEANKLELNGKLSFKDARLKSKESFSLNGELVASTTHVQAQRMSLQGQLIAEKEYTLEISDLFDNRGNLIAGNAGTVKAHVVNLERNSVVMTQQGKLAINGAARVANSGAVIANQTRLSSNIIITNYIGAIVKGVSCVFNAPQVNQAGFVLSGQKTTLSSLDWALNTVHAGINFAELTSLLPAPTAIAARGYLLIAKTLYRGGDLLRRHSQGETIQTPELISLVLENIVPSIGLLSSSQEKAALLVNVLYQFYGAYYSEDKFIYKSLEFLEAFTRALSVCSGGLLTPENVEWLQLATQIVNSSRMALKVADISASAYRAWSNEDHKELAKAKENLKSISEVVFREALYKLEPYELIGFDLSVKPIDIIHFILNQGHRSELYVQSIVYGVLHAANRAGVLDESLQNDLQTTARMLFRMAHWKALYNNFKEDKLSTQAVVNETLNSLIVVLSSDKIRATLNRSNPEAVTQAQTLDQQDQVEHVPAAMLEQIETQSATDDQKPVSDIPGNLTQEELDKINEDALEAIKQTIPEYQKQDIMIDVSALAQSNLSKESSLHAEELGTTLIKSLIEVQKAVNGEYATHGYLGMFVNMLHNEGIMEVTGDIGLNIRGHATNNHVVKASGTVSVYGQDLTNRKEDGSLLSKKVSQTIHSYFINFESGVIDAGEAIYLTCLGLIENFGDIKSLGKIKTTANRIIRNHKNGRIISKKDVEILCDLLAKNEGQIVGEFVHFEGHEKALNEGTIIGVEKIRLMSDKLVVNAKYSRLVSKEVAFESKEIEKEGAIQADVVTTQASGNQGPEKLTWHKDEEDNIGLAVIEANENTLIDNDAFTKIQLTDLTLDHVPDASVPLLNISSDFANIFQLHLPQSDALIPIWQLPKVHSDATFILDAPGATLFSSGNSQTYDSAFRFVGRAFDFSADHTLFLREAFFDVSNIFGQGANTLLTLKEGGLFQAESMSNQGHIWSDDILFWNVKALQNDAQLEHSVEYFTYSKQNPIAQACDTTKIVENSGTIEALGHRGYVGDFGQSGGKFLSGNEGNFIYYIDSFQEAIQTQHGENPTGVLHDAGQNWYVKPEWHNAEIGSTGQNIFIGSDRMTTAGFSFWGDQYSFLYGSRGIFANTKYARYEIDQILSLTRHGKVNGVAHEHEVGYIPTKDDIAANNGNVVLAAPEGSIKLDHVVISSAGDTSLLAKEEVAINGIALEKQSSLSYKSRSLLSTKRVESKTQETLVYSSYIFTGGELIVRCHDFTLDAVQGALGGADIVANRTTFRGQDQTYQNTTTIKEFKIGITGQELLEVLKGHNAKAVFTSLMNSCGWNQAELENLLNVENMAELPKPLLNSARNAWNMSAFVAHACNEFGGTPADFIGVFTDQIGLTMMGADNQRHFNPKFTFSTSKTTTETHSSQTISTNLFVGGTFRLLGNELHLLDGATVDAEHLRIFLIEGIKATSGHSTYSYRSNTQTRSIGANPLNPEDASFSVGHDKQTQQATEYSLAKLHARDSAQINGGKKIDGEIQIQAETGAVKAQEMSFTTLQNTKYQNHRSTGVNLSTGGAVGAHHQIHAVDEVTTNEKAGVALGEGDVAANEIHLANGSKIQTSTLTRLDDEDALPTVTGTVAQDHSEQRKEGGSFNFTAQGEPYADLSHSHKVTEAVHCPTVIADNVATDTLPGINTVADKETEVVKDSNHSFAVAAFIPNQEKVQQELASMKEAAKGLHWLYGTRDPKPVHTDKIEVETHLEPQALTVQLEREVLSPVFNMTDRIEAQSEIAGLSGFDAQLSIYEFGNPGTWFVESNNYLDSYQDRTIPLYSLSSSQDEHPLVTFNENGSFNINIYGDAAPKPNKPFSLPSAVPLHDDNPVWDHIFGFCRGVEKARDGIVNAILHPIDTGKNIGVTIWDGYNAMGDLMFGLSTQGARERNAQRGVLYHDAMEDFALGESVYRTETLSEIGTSIVFGGALGGAPRGLISKGMDIRGLAIPTGYGYAYQSFNPKYFRARQAVKDGKGMYRAGTRPTETSRGSKGIEGQFWAVEESPNMPTYAIKYGIPEANVKNIDFAIEGKLKPNEAFITRPAPGLGQNPGGGLEVVTNSGAVALTNPSVPFTTEMLAGNRPLLFQAIDKGIQTMASEPALGALASVNETANEPLRAYRK